VTRDRSKLERKMGLLILLGAEPMNRTVLASRAGLPGDLRKAMTNELIALGLVREQAEPKRRRRIAGYGTKLELTWAGREALVHWEAVTESLREPQAKTVLVTYF
jgi:hypothetical protein